MSRQDYRRAAPVDEPEEVPGGAPDIDVDSGGRLVKDEELRVVRQGARNEKAPLHAAGELAGLRVPLLPELDALQDLLGALPCKCPSHPVEPGLVHDNVKDPVELAEVEVLRHEPDEALCRHGASVKVAPEDAHRAGGLLHEPGNDANGRGLPGAVGAQKRVEVALTDGKAHSVERLHAALVDLAEFPDR